MNDQPELEIEFQVGRYTIRVKGYQADNVLRVAREAQKALGPKVEEQEAIKVTERYPVEFIKQKGPKTDMDRIVCACYFLTKYRKIKSITKRDLDEFFPEAGMPMPLNMNDMINKNVDRGYLAPTKKLKEGLKSYYITTDGERFVETGLKEEA
jgi:hypothetical protein